jgi:hypothetical protein
VSGVSCRQVPDRHLGLRRLSCGVPRVNGSTALFFQQSLGRFRHMTLVRLELLPACTARARLVADLEVGSSMHCWVCKLGSASIRTSSLSQPQNSGLAFPKLITPRARAIGANIHGFFRSGPRASEPRELEMEANWALVHGRLSEFGMSPVLLVRPRHNTKCFRTVLAIASACATLSTCEHAGIGWHPADLEDNCMSSPDPPAIAR